MTLTELAPVLERDASLVPARAALFRGDFEQAVRLLPDAALLTRPADLNARSVIWKNAVTNMTCTAHARGCASLSGRLTPPT